MLIRTVTLEQGKYPYDGCVVKHLTNVRKSGATRDTVFIMGENVFKHTQYARYLMETHLGRFLTKDEEVDHINGDHNNNSINNLQILTPMENKLKIYLCCENCRSSGMVVRELVCPVCNKHFIRRETTINVCINCRKINNGIRDEGICCSKSCGHIRYLINNNKFLSIDDITYEKYKVYGGVIDTIKRCGPKGFYKVVQSIKRQYDQYYYLPIFEGIVDLAVSDEEWGKVVYNAYWCNSVNAFKYNFDQKGDTIFRMMNFIGWFEYTHENNYESFR